MPPHKHRVVLVDNIYGIRDPAIRRLAYRAGVPIIGKDVYEEIRNILGEFLEDVLRIACIYQRNANRKTVMVSDIVAALDYLGYRTAHAEK